MITLILVDLDNELQEDARRIRGLPSPAAPGLRVTALLRSTAAGGAAREVVVVVAMNDATTMIGSVSWSAIRLLANGVAAAVEARSGRPTPMRIEVEPVVVPRLPEAADGALVRMVHSAASVRGAGEVAEVVLLSEDWLLRAQVQGVLSGFHMDGDAGIFRWKGAPYLRSGGALSAETGAEPQTSPTRVGIASAHGAWAATQEAQFNPCELKASGVALLQRPWLRTQLSVTSQSSSGPERLRTLLDGEQSSLALASNEVVDFQEGVTPHEITPSRIDDVGPGTVRAYWGESFAQVLRTELPFDVIKRCVRLTLQSTPAATVHDRASLKTLEGALLSDAGWTVTFSKRHGFHCEVDRPREWPAIWWDRRAGHGNGSAAKVASPKGCVRTPSELREIPIGLKVVNGRLEPRALAGPGEVRVEQQGRRGDLLLATSGDGGRCVLLCTSDQLKQGSSVACTLVQEVKPAALAAALRTDKNSLERQGVFELPIVVEGVRNA